MENEKICPKCGAKCNNEDVFCSECGFKMSENLNKTANNENNVQNSTNSNPEVNKCPYCYSDVPALAAKCPKCGEWLKKDTSIGCYGIISISAFIISTIIGSLCCDNFGIGLAIGLGIVIVLWIYFIPAWIAEIKGHSSRTAIFMVNFFFGWSLIGWVIALIWAISGGRR